MLESSDIQIRFTLVIMCTGTAHTSSVQNSAVCMTGKSIEVFYEVFTEWSFGISCPGRGIKK